MSHSISLKPVCSLKLKNINPAELGVVFPNGQIKFATKEIAEKYIKKSILDALDNNIERLIYAKDSTIYTIKDGDSDAVAIDTSEIPNIPSCTSYHGHPIKIIGNFTASFSSGDIIAFLADNKVFGLKKMVLYNSAGEKSVIENKSDKISLLCKSRLPVGLKMLLYRLNPLVWLNNRFIDKYCFFIHQFSSIKKYENNLQNRCTKEELTKLEAWHSDPSDYELEDWHDGKISALMWHDAVKKLISKSKNCEYTTTFSYLKD